MTDKPLLSSETPAEIAVNEEVAGHWELWSNIIGATALPRIERLRDVIPTLTTAILSTADGLNLCSIGVERDNVGRLAALNSSMYAIASSQADVIGRNADAQSTIVNVSTGNGHIVLASFVQKPLGQLLLAISAEELPLGMLVVHTRAAVDDIQKWLTDAQLH